MNSPEETSKRKGVQVSTIISSLEKEVNEIIKECNTRAIKTQLLSVKEIIKILEKKLKNYNDLIQNEEDYKNLKEEISVNKEAFSKEKEILKQENNQLKQFINGLPERFKLKLQNKDLTVNEKPDSKDEMIKCFENKINLLNSQFNDEKTRNYRLSNHIKSLETSIAKLREEYEMVISKAEKRDHCNEDYERIISGNDISHLVYKKTNGELKEKIEELSRINADLKLRILQSEEVIKNHTGDLKNFIIKNSNLMKKVEEYEKNKKSMANDISIKENRLSIIRQMNNKLEQKSNKIVKKFENFKKFEEKSNEVSSNCNKLIAIIEELNDKLNYLNEENHVLKGSFDEKNREVQNLKLILEEMEINLKLQEKDKDTLLDKNQDLERNLKKILEATKDSSFKDTKEISNLRGKDQLNSKFFKSLNTNNVITANSNNFSSSNFLGSNMNSQSTNENMKIEELKPARIFVNQNNEIEIKNQ